MNARDSDGDGEGGTGWWAMLGGLRFLRSAAAALQPAIGRLQVTRGRMMITSREAGEGSHVEVDTGCRSCACRKHRTAACWSRQNDQREGRRSY
jgi:hypothetical protein